MPLIPLSVPGYHAVGLKDDWCFYQLPGGSVVPLRASAHTGKRISRLFQLPAAMLKEIFLVDRFANFTNWSDVAAEKMMTAACGADPFLNPSAIGFRPKSYRYTDGGGVHVRSWQSPLIGNAAK